MFNDSSILVTGGTGSFGKKFVRMTLARYNPKKIIIFSRDEMKQWEMQQEFKNDPRLRFFIGDVRDKDRLHRAMNGVDHVIHAAAIKIVPTAEYNPFECIKTNVMGAMNLIDVALDRKVKRVVALSTDKACNPINLYGATKLCADKLFVAANAYCGDGDTRFSVVRYGNVMGSRGSVIPFFRSVAQKGEITVTDERMTRFMITLEQGVELVWHALVDCQGGEIYVKKIPSMRVIDIARTVAPHARIKITGIRPGEKLHEQMVSAEDGRKTLDYPEHYVILPQIEVGTRRSPPRIPGKPLEDGFCYSSETNTRWMEPAELRRWMHREYGDAPTLEDRAVLGSSPTLEVPSTIFIELSQQLAPTGVDGAQIQQVAEFMQQHRDAEAVSVVKDMLHRATVSSPAGRIPTELHIVKGVAEARLGWNQEALHSVLGLMSSQPASTAGKELLSRLTEFLKAEQVIDFSS